VIRVIRVSPFFFDPRDPRDPRPPFFLIRAIRMIRVPFVFDPRNPCDPRRS
jgi:hypothetical protein